MERFQIQEAFTRLKPFCDSLMKDPNVNNACRVADTVKNISGAVIQDLSEYILFPIITHLQNDIVSTAIKEELVKTMTVVLSKVRINKLEYFNKLYACLLIQIYDKNKSDMVIQDHEELKEAVLLCIKCLVHSCFTQVTELLYTRQNASKIGQGILLAVTMARKEKSRSVRLAAIEAVMALCQIDDEVDKSDIILQDQVADVIMLFLPGIASGLQEVAMGNEIQGHKVTMMAIRAWGRVISLVMHDLPAEENISPMITINEKHDSKSVDPFKPLLNQDDIERYLKQATRNTEWFQAAATKLNILVQELDTLKKHSHYKVRIELAQSISLLLTTSSRNMKPNIVPLIEYLISLSEDDVLEVSNEASTALNAISAKYMLSTDMRNFIELLEENFYGVLTRLPRLVRKSDDNEQLAHLNQLAGYIKLLGEQRLPHIMVSPAHVQRLLLALIYISEIECNDISLLQTVNVKDLDESAYIYGPHSWQQFKFMQHNLCVKKLFAICKLLGELGDLRILVDNIIKLMSEMPHYKKELILLLNWIIHVPIKDSQNIDIYKEVVDLYINHDLWYLPIEVTEDVSLYTAKCNVVQICLLTEGLGLIAENLKRGYQIFLLKTLYFVIERAGSGHGLISFVGTQTLEKIAQSQEHDTIRSLLHENVDYFSYHVTMKLKRIERYPGVLDVVTLVMKYSTMDVLPCLKQIVEDVLFQSNTNFQKRNSYAFLKAFYIFVTCIKKLVNLDNVDVIEDVNIPDECKSSKVIETLLEYYEAKKIDEKIDHMEEEDLEADVITSAENEESNVETAEEEEKLENLPSYVKMVVEVLKHALHFLPSKDVQKSLIAMLTLQDGLPILSQWENQMLPIIHQLWHPLVDRFQEENVLIINRAWQLLQTLAQLSKDFIRNRTLQQVLPALSKFLTKSAKESQYKPSDHVYKFTQVYKLQKELLSSLGRTAHYLNIHERETCKILTITELYLSKYQNPILQECCVKLYKDVAVHNEDIVWVKCLSLWHSKISNIPIDSTFNLSDLKQSTDISSKEYYKNVRTIIDHIQEKYVNKPLQSNQNCTA
ncbi:hypothetical protein KM043_002445 [Ampulex compressa]|nr:hypothetical protein KM043_002445 [Ampulex compressa]